MDCTVAYTRYERHHECGLERAHFKAKDLYEVCQKLAKHLGIYYHESDFEDGNEYYAVSDGMKESLGQEIWDSIMETNGDGCDMIHFLQMGDDVLIDDCYDCREEWD